MTNNKTLGGLARARAYLRTNNLNTSQHDYNKVGTELDKSIRDWLIYGNTKDYHVDLTTEDIGAALQELTPNDINNLSQQDRLLYLEYLLTID